VCACGVPEDIRHLFQECVSVSDLWDCLYSRVAKELSAIPSDLELVILDFAAASTHQERLVVVHLGTFVSEVWKPRHSLRPLARQELAAAFRAFFPGCRPFF
jgi:hypothetical protein